MTPPICAAALMWTRRADLRARADQRVRVDQRALADVGADVDVHRRHADHARRDDRRRRGSSIRRARCGRRRRRANLLQRQRVLVEERPAAVIGRHVDQTAEAEAEQDALLDPGVDAPAGRRRRVGLGGADDAVGQRLAQVGEGRPRLVPARRQIRLGDRATRCGRAGSCARPGGRGHAGRGRRARARCGGATPRTATPSAAGTLRRAGPSRAIAALTGIGFDSTKLTMHQRQVARGAGRAPRPSRRARRLRPCGPSRRESRWRRPRSRPGRRPTSPAA